MFDIWTIGSDDADNAFKVRKNRRGNLKHISRIKKEKKSITYFKILLRLKIINIIRNKLVRYSDKLIFKKKKKNMHILCVWLMPSWTEFHVKQY